ncbi:3-hydroxybutyryl-CoA dehydrogenase [Kitasatospora sp. NPDC056531]|uniref:3-hydroxybutyryl-CoA dehydrogenase n=1 Tax=Kitasatospora sp. NPDC056531 TaxID=3345856 RepID=UPI0036B6E8FF
MNAIGVARPGPEADGEEADGISRVGVVGCGTMGAGFAEACARAGLGVLVAVPGEDSATRGRARLLRSLDHGVRKGRVTEPERDAAVSRVEFTTDLADMSDRQLILEAVPEREDVKREVFGVLGKVVDDPSAILASTTSSIPIVNLAQATDRAAQVVGVHFFNPVTVLPLVELTGSLLTAEPVLDRTEAFVSGVLGKRVIRSKDRAGFVVNALLVPYLLAAVRMVESGFASAEDIDAGMKLGCAHPMGPLALADHVGLDTLAAVGEAMYEEFHEPLYAPPPLLSRMVAGGLMGRKTGQGFYRHG